MNKHYLKNLSVEVCLANAGFVATNPMGYVLPRSRGSSLSDAYVKRLIEFFYPDLYATCERAERAYRMPGHEVDDDHSSTTNYRFTDNLREITFFWLQDACVLLHRYPDLATSAPWCTLLHNQTAKDDLTTLGRIVLKHEADCMAKTVDVVQTQKELLSSVRNGVAYTASVLDTRLSRLPGEVAERVEADWEHQMVHFESSVCRGLSGVLRKMASGISAAMDDGAATPPPLPQHRRYPTAATRSTAATPPTPFQDTLRHLEIRVQWSKQMAPGIKKSLLLRGLQRGGCLLSSLLSRPPLTPPQPQGGLVLSRPQLRRRATWRVTLQQRWVALRRQRVGCPPCQR